MSSTILVTGASSGFGALTVRGLADAGHRVYAAMRGTKEHNKATVADLDGYARDRRVDLHAVELDVTSTAPRMRRSPRSSPRSAAWTRSCTTPGT
ncbi:SDR family NAD(P)-dependent oxidoreductase [Amycolatopsis sp. NPDC005003]